jgi:hypothetical protein
MATPERSRSAGPGSHPRPAGGCIRPAKERGNRLNGHPRKTPGEVPLSPGRSRHPSTALFGGTAIHGRCAVPTARRGVEPHGYRHGNRVNPVRVLGGPCVAPQVPIGGGCTVFPELALGNSWMTMKPGRSRRRRGWRQGPAWTEVDASGQPHPPVPIWFLTGTRRAGRADSSPGGRSPKDSPPGIPMTRGARRKL